MSRFSSFAKAKARCALAAGLLVTVALGGPADAQSNAQKIQSDVFTARTGLPRAWVVSNKPGLVVAIRERENLAARMPGDKVRLQGEVVDDEAAERLGYKSMRSLVEVNCETLRDRVVEMEVFASPNLKGAGQKRVVPGGWVQPSQDAYMADVIRTVCRAAPQRMEVASNKAPEPAPKPAPPAVKPAPPKPAPVPEPPVAPPASKVVSPSRPPPVSPDGPIVTAQRVPQVVEASPSPALSAAAPLPTAPGPVPAPATAPAKVAAKATSPAKPQAAVGGPAAQVGSLDSEADARRALKGLAALMADGLSTHIQPTKVGDRTFYRAQIVGFADRAEAAAFCASVTRKGGACFVR